MIRPFITGIIILLCTSVFESAVLSNLTFLPAIPDISLICVVFIALHNGKTFGETSGFFSGLFLDFLGACPLGFNCLYRTIIGYFGGKFCKILNTEGFIVPFLIVLIATGMKVLLVQFIALLFPSVTVAYKILSLTFVFELLLNSFLAPFVFRLLRVFKNSLILRPENVR
ncbi:rod shape-determining protein MreD [Treponema sp.]|uniref:rod shape-determining protein MreD n=1 Tax=Treponema sp. TaxID=166 RepID=UPI00298E926C|nr:rod shape-determining protein MreD [Treponema sp.]MCQ2241440.1 rod shape-determining protein MreD [Treponema sp.]